MDDQKLVAALEAAAKSYATERRLAAQIPLEAAEIGFIALNSGLQDAGLSVQIREGRTRRTRFARQEFDHTSLKSAGADLPEAEWDALVQRIRQEIGAMKRFARTSDARYDINRHVALVRLLKALEGNEPGAEKLANTVAAKRKRRSATTERQSSCNRSRLRGDDHQSEAPIQRSGHQTI